MKAPKTEYIIGLLFDYMLKNFQRCDGINSNRELKIGKSNSRLFTYIHIYIYTIYIFWLGVKTIENRTQIEYNT